MIKKFMIILSITLLLLISIYSSLAYDIGIKKEFPFIKNSPERPSPADRIKESEIQVKKDKIIIYVNDASISRYADTNSMDPLLDQEANGIEITPNKPEEIQPGDIVVYQKDNDLIVHRVISTSRDKEGWYAILKGDNNPLKDEEKVRFDQIRYILIGILY